MVLTNFIVVTRCYRLAVSTNALTSFQTKHITVLYTAGAQNPAKECKFDYFNMHHSNAAYFAYTFSRHAAVPTSAKIRLLEWKGRLDIANYIARNRPKLYIDNIKNYDPKRYIPEHENGRWNDIATEAILSGDEGHLSKLIHTIMGARK